VVVGLLGLSWLLVEGVHGVLVGGSVVGVDAVLVDLNM
jgi:hypothetical protein